MSPGAMLDLHSQAVVFPLVPGPPRRYRYHALAADDEGAAHGPCPNDDIAKYFCADIPKVVASTRASLWICGHTHYNVDFMLGETRILSNQGGYPHESGRKGCRDTIRGWLSKWGQILNGRSGGTRDDPVLKIGSPKGAMNGGRPAARDA